MKFLKLLILILIFGAVFIYLYSQQHKTAFDPTINSRQMVLVLAKDWKSTIGTLQRYDRNTSKESWKKVGEVKTVSLGKNGLGWGIGLHGNYLTNDSIVIEGSKKSPAGIFALGPAFGKYTNKYIGIKMPYEQITQYTFCPDDPKSKYYNRIVNTYQVKNDWKSAEDMNKYMEDGFYTYGIMIQDNYAKPIPGSGSCFFIHVSPEQGRPTLGCTAFDENSVKELLLWLDPQMNPIIVQLPWAIYHKFAAQWHLPEQQMK